MKDIIKILDEAEERAEEMGATGCVVILVNKDHRCSSYKTKGGETDRLLLDQLALVSNNIIFSLGKKE